MIRKFFANIIKGIKISRPIFWLGHFAALLLGAVVAENFTWLDWRNVWLFILFGPALTFFIYGINDVYDQESDLKNPRKGGIWGEKTLAFEPKIIMIIALICGLVFLFYMLTINFFTFAFTLVFLLFLGYYSVPPIRLKNYPLIDNIVGGAFYAFGLMFMAYLIFSQGELPPPSTYPIFIAITLGGFVSQSLGAVLDEKVDREVDEKTSATYFGGLTVAIYSLVLPILCIIWVYPAYNIMLLISVLAVISFAFFFDGVRQSEFMKMHFVKFYLLALILFSIFLTFQPQYILILD